MNRLHPLFAALAVLVVSVAAVPASAQCTDVQASDYRVAVSCTNAGSGLCAIEPLPSFALTSNVAGRMECVTSVTWSFGDGSAPVTAGPGTPVEHRFPAAGVYTVTANVKTAANPAGVNVAGGIRVGRGLVFLGGGGGRGVEGGTVTGPTIFRSNSDASTDVRWELTTSSGGTPTEISPTSGVTTMPAGVSSVELSFQVQDDNVFTGTRNYVLRLLSATNDYVIPFTATVGAPNAVAVQVEDDDYATVAFTTSSMTVREDAGTVRFPVVRTGDLAPAFTVRFLVAEHLLPGNGFVGFASGQTEAFIELTPTNDRTPTGNRRTWIILANQDLPPNVRIGTPNQLHIVIEEDDSAGSGPDLRVTHSGPASVEPGETFVVTILVANVGNDDAQEPRVSSGWTAAVGELIGSPRPSQGTCPSSGFCLPGRIAAGATASIEMTFRPRVSSGTFRIESVGHQTYDVNPANNGSTHVVGIGCPEAPAPVSPTGNDVPTSGTLRWNGAAESFQVYLGPADQNGCATLLGTTAANELAYSGLAPDTTYAWRVVAVRGGCTDAPGSCSTFRTAPATNTPAADVQVTQNGPSSVTRGESFTMTATVTNGGSSAATGVSLAGSFTGPATFVSATTTQGSCSGATCTVGTLPSGGSAVVSLTFTATGAGTFSSSVTVSAENDSNSANDSATRTVSIGCPAPEPLSPIGNGAPASGTLTWTSVGADSYQVYLNAVSRGACSVLYGTTTSTEMPYSGLQPDTVYTWSIVAVTNGCPDSGSFCVTFRTTADPCAALAQPVARAVSHAGAGVSYSVSWDPVGGAVSYEVDEADNAAFTGAQTRTTTGTSLSYAQTAPRTIYYRVRAIGSCAQSPWSEPVRVAIVPAGTTATAPAGATENVVLRLFVPGRAGETLAFHASSGHTWLTVTPSTGTLPPEGVTLTATVDPAALTNGTHTASVNITHGGGSLSIPVSISILTPVASLASKPEPPEDALVIPAVGHLAGMGSHWQSDVRIANTGSATARYALTFTSTSGAVQQTVVTAAPGATIALDDIIGNWFGAAALGASMSGMLEIRSADGSPLRAVASSRTYNVAPNGTLGQFIPALRVSSLLRSGESVSLQQIAQSAAYRTNVGVIEGTGRPADVLIVVRNAAGASLGEISVSLPPYGQRQWNNLLAERGIALEDGRIEVRVTGGTGRIAAFASVIDNVTQDPLLVTGTRPRLATTRVLPGVADLSSAFARWQTDMHLFNAGAAPQTATLTFLPWGGPPRAAIVTLAPGEVRAATNAVQTLFGTSSAGGAVLVSTPTVSELVVTARTYNQTGNGTYGQFLEGVTPDEAAGVADGALHVLQVEDSARYRTNVGLFEVSGNAATIELHVVAPDSVSTVTTMTLAPYEYRQFGVRDLGLGDLYNARIAIRVVAGSGRVAGYGSLIDMRTQDPTYIPAQR